MKQVKMSMKTMIQNNAVESFKTLRTNLVFCGQAIQTVAVTSCSPSDGKSTVSWNLANSIADSGKKVIYIDADMRRSVFTGRMRIRNKVKGLSQFLSQQLNIDEILYQTEKENLYVIFSGKFPPNPSELLGSKTFVTLVDALKESFDYVIIDTPPLGNVIDAAIVSTVCDGTILVVSHKETKYKMAQGVIKQIEQTGGHMLGVVLNKANFKDFGGRYGGYYYGDYGSYYGVEPDSHEKKDNKKKS